MQTQGGARCGDKLRGNRPKIHEVSSLGSLMSGNIWDGEETVRLPLPGCPQAGGHSI